MQHCVLQYSRGLFKNSVRVVVVETMARTGDEVVSSRMLFGVQMHLAGWRVQRVF